MQQRYVHRPARMKKIKAHDKGKELSEKEEYVVKKKSRARVQSAKREIDEVEWCQFVYWKSEDMEVTIQEVRDRCDAFQQSVTRDTASTIQHRPFGQYFVSPIGFTGC